jgi:hypothetical protein
VYVRHSSQKQNEIKIKILMDTVQYLRTRICMQYESTLSSIQYSDLLYVFCPYEFLKIEEYCTFLHYFSFLQNYLIFK